MSWLLISNYILIIFKKKRAMKIFEILFLTVSFVVVIAGAVSAIKAKQVLRAYKARH